MHPTSLSTVRRVFALSLAGCCAVASTQACSSSTSGTPQPVADSGAADSAVADTSTQSDGAACLNQAPPSGFSAVAPGDGKQGTYGSHVSMAVDENGDPMIAFVHLAPSGGQGEDSVLYFTRWDRCTGKWLAPVAVDTVGSVSSGVPARQVALARDASTGALGIAFEHIGPAPAGMSNKTPTVYVGQSSDNGKTWTTSQVSQHDQTKEGDIQSAGNPGLAMYGGKMFIAYAQNNIDCITTDGGVADTCNGWYAEGTPAAWTRTTLPNLPAGFGVNQGSPVVVALDSAHMPAVAYLVTPYTGYDMQAAFWRPGSAPVKVTDSLGHQDDSPALALVFNGTAPRLVAQLAIGGATADLVFVKSADGATWDAPVTLPHDNSDATAFYVTLAVDKSGALAVAGRAQTGSGDAVCGAPKVSRSTDGATWTTCGADTTKQLTGVGGQFVSAAFGADGKLQIAFEVTTNTTDPITSGVALWREP